MGGEEDDPARNEWDRHPERPAILVGTQDMLLSRALNRGYGMARARWPMHFGLLNNDCLWVLDETQLMGVGVRTSAQLEGLRRRLGVAAATAAWWTSATLDSRLLSTPDHPSLPPTLALNETDLASSEVSKRVRAVKKLAVLSTSQSAPLTLDGDSAKATVSYITALATAVLEKHESGSLTLVILNRVNRARELYAALEKSLRPARKTPDPAASALPDAPPDAMPELSLIHSRFRPMEREKLTAALEFSLPPAGKIIIATQAIEAGVDISARTLITELAPWSSLVQRFGRCNRKGEYNTTGGADIFWLNLEPPPDDVKAAASLALPYTPEQLNTARALLRQTTDASPAALEKLHVEEPLAETSLLRRKDLVELFDTTPDLTGLDLDIGRYIRDDEDRDVQLFWRELPASGKPPVPLPPAAEIQPCRRELVRVSVSEFRKFAEKKENKGNIWKWGPLDGEWQNLQLETTRITPGQIYLINVTCGGYSETLGWTGEKSKEPIPLLPPPPPKSPPPKPAPRDGLHDDESQTGDTPEDYQSIEQHTEAVLRVLDEKLRALPDAAPWGAHLITAARWHDVGKSHASFQCYLTRERTDIPEIFRSCYLAKSTRRPGVKNERPRFRHELASALAWLQVSASTDAFAATGLESQNLIAWLIATHHGKVRLSLRAFPGERQPEPDRLHARGIWQGDPLPGDPKKTLSIGEVPLDSSSPLELDLSLMRMGDATDTSGNPCPSWTTRALSLRDSPDLGIFRLAWLETLLRAADAEGSQIKEKTEIQPKHDGECSAFSGSKWILFEKLLPELNQKYAYYPLNAIQDILTENKIRLSNDVLQVYLSEALKKKITYDAGRGWYSRFSQAVSLNPQPVFELVQAMRKEFVLMDFCAWSTAQINPWMQHLLAQPVAFLYVPREAMDTVGESLQDIGWEVSINPGKNDISKIRPGNRMVVLRPTHSKQPFPLNKYHATIEHVLVELLAETNELQLMDSAESEKVFIDILNSGLVKLAEIKHFAKCRQLTLPDIDTINQRQFF
jgi:CRISPR-associated endonuclease/helicase Cas3